MEQGAATSVWCATNPRLDGLGGVYCEDCDIAIVNEGGCEEGRQLLGLRSGGGGAPVAAVAEWTGFHKI